jgi:hypothetical protein
VQVHFLEFNTRRSTPQTLQELTRDEVLAQFGDAHHAAEFESLGPAQIPEAVEV